MEIVLCLIGFALTVIAAIGISDVVSAVQIVIWLAQLQQLSWLKNGNEADTRINIEIGDLHLRGQLTGKVDAAALGLLVQNLAELASNTGDGI